MKLLNAIINDLQWSDAGIVCSNAEEFKLVHKFLREAVLDRYICNSRVAGVRVNAEESKRTAAKTYIAKHQAVGESYAELTAQLNDKVFFFTNNQVVSVTLDKGVNTMSNVSFISKGNKLSVLSIKDNVCRALKDGVMLDLFVTYGCGYKPMSENSKIIKSQCSSQYFPCNTDYSLAEYVRVLPPHNDNVVHLRFYNGMTPQLFKIILNNWLSFIDKGVMSEEVKTWLQKYN